MDTNEECGQFAKLKELASMASPELISRAVLEMPDMRCLELCGGVRKDCLQAILHPKAKPTDSPGDAFLIESAGSIEAFFRAGVNPAIERCKRDMSALARRFNVYLRQGMPIPEQEIAEYKRIAAYYDNDIAAMFNNNNFMRGEGGNFVLTGLFRMLAHDFNNHAAAAIGYSSIEIDKVSGGKIPEDLTFHDHYDQLPLLHIGPEEVRLIPDDIANLTGQAVTAFQQKEASKLAHPVNIINRLPPSGLGSLFAKVHPRIYTGGVGEMLRNAGHAMLREGGNVLVEGGRLNGDVVTTIEDDGIGMSRELIAKILGSGNHSSRADGTIGTGRGLKLAKAYIEEVLDGRLLIESTVGRGTKLSIVLPFARGN
jgi:hypothetical protein